MTHPREHFFAGKRVAVDFSDHQFAFELGYAGGSANSSVKGDGGARKVARQAYLGGVLVPVGFDEA